MSENLYKQKYLKYKKKYTELKGGKGKIYDKNDIEIKEKQPLYIKTGVMIQKFITKITIEYITNKCKKKQNDLLTDEKKYEAHIKLIKEYDIDKTLIDCNDQRDEMECIIKKDISYDDLVKLADLQKKCLTKYKSKNDFFIRTKLGLPPINSELTNKNIVSAADAYCTIYESEETSKKYWIKGTKFTIKTLLYGTSDTNDTDNFINKNPKYVTIMRLAPKHYHRFHSPVTGKIVSIYQLGNSYYSVQPSIINSGINVYTENKRCVVTIEYNGNKILKMIIVGATCVGSIDFNKKLYPNSNDKELRFEPESVENKSVENKSVENKSVENIDKPKKYIIKPDVEFNQNEELGNFNFGGSTIIYVNNSSDVAKTVITNKIIKNSMNSDEYEVDVGTELFTVK